MAIDTSIQVCLCKVLNFSMKICYNYVKKYPTLSSVLVFVFLLYMFLPSVFTFLMYSLPVLISAVVVYRVYTRTEYKRIENVKGYKKIDDNPKIVGDDLNVGDTNGGMSANSQAAIRRNAKENNKEDFSRTHIEDKGMVFSTIIKDDLVDKNTVVEENLKEIREVKVDEGSKNISGGKLEAEKESSEDSEYGEDGHEYNKNKVVEWTADDQKNLMDLGNSELERNRRLESLIARRKARQLLSLQVRNTLTSKGKHDPCDRIASILVPRSNPFLEKSNRPDTPMPGSAPSFLLPMHNPFDLPYDPNEEKPNLTGDSFGQEFLTDQQRDMMLRRHESFSFGASFPTESRINRYETFFQDFPFKPRASEKVENTRTRNHLDGKGVDKVIEREFSQESEAIFKDHEESRREMRTKKILEEENINDKSSSSSSSEENILMFRPNKAAILRSLTSLARTNSAKDIYGRANSFSYDTRKEDHIFYRDMHNHTRNNSLASDMQVEFSEISSPQTISSPDEEESSICEDMKKEIGYSSEEMWDPCLVDKHVSQSRENIVEQESTCVSDCLDAFSSQNLDFRELEKPEDLNEEMVTHTSPPINSEKLEGSSDSPEKAKGNVETIYNLSDSEASLNNDMENLNATNNQMVEKKMVHELPPEILNHSATQNSHHRSKDSTAQLSPDIEKLQSPRFIDTVSCVPFYPRNEEMTNYDSGEPASSSRFLQELQEPLDPPLGRSIGKAI